MIKKLRFNSVKTRLSLTLLLVVALTTALLAWGIIRVARQQVRDDLKEHLKDVAALCTLLVDAEAHRTLVDPSQESSPTYHSIRRALRSAVATSDRFRYIYTMRPAPDGELIFVVDADENAEEMAHLGEVYKNPSPFLVAHVPGLTQPMVEEEFYTDEWGTFLSGIAPVRAKDGSMECIVGVDIEAQWILEHERQLILTAWGVIGTVLIPVGAFGLLAGRQLARPLLKLKEGAQQLAKGDLSCRIRPTGSDELQQLASAINQMARDLDTHIRKLGEERATRARIEADLQIAREVQQALLPARVPEVANFQIAGWNQPADATGGDYYDWQQMPDGRWAISIADATGHGIGPALVTAVCRAYSRASFPTGDEMGVLMDRINTLLIEDLTASRFVTFAAGLLDPAQRRLDLISAGHGPLLFYKAARETVDQLNADHVPFGVLGDVGYGPPRSFQFNDGDMFVLITDGFFEWTNTQGEQFGIERVTDVLRAAAHQTPREIIESLYQNVRSFVGAAEQSDDLTAVIIKCSEESGTG